MTPPDPSTPLRVSARTARLRVFVSLTKDDGAEYTSGQAALAATAQLRQLGHDAHTMMELGTDDHLRLGLSGFADFMSYAITEVVQADALVCVVTGNRIGNGMILEVGAALAAGVRVTVARTPGAPAFLDTLAADVVVFTTLTELAENLNGLYRP